VKIRNTTLNRHDQTARLLAVSLAVRRRA